MVRFTSLVLFATLVISGLSSPLVDEPTVVGDLNRIDAATKGAHQAVITFSGSMTIQYAIVSISQRWTLSESWTPPDVPFHLRRYTSKARTLLVYSMRARTIWSVVDI
jgi:hypothetical protein